MKIGVGTVLIVGTVGYLLYQGWVKANAALGLTVSIKDIKYGSSDLSKTRIDLTLGIINPSGETFSFTRFFGQLRFNGELLANAMKEGTGEGIKIQPAGETILTFPVYINHLNTATSLINIVTKIAANQPIEGLQFNGMLYVGSNGIPVNQTVSLGFLNQVAPTVSGNRISSCSTCATGKLGGVLN